MRTRSPLVGLIEHGTYALRLSICLTRCVTRSASDTWKAYNAVIGADLRANSLWENGRVWSTVRIWKYCDDGNE
jgi:hypothetical protein